MPSRPTDLGIPTLTQRAEPSLSIYGACANDGAQAPVLTELANDDAQAYAGHAVPMLTDIADASESPEPSATALPDATVLTARLQAEVEQLMREALADAIEQIQARMDAELPAIVSRVFNGVRPG